MIGLEYLGSSKKAVFLTGLLILCKCAFKVENMELCKNLEFVRLLSH